MSDEFDRDALFSDIDKIMAKQGYPTYMSSSEPVEVEAAEVSADSIPKEPSQVLMDKIERVMNQDTTEENRIDIEPESEPEPEVSIEIPKPEPVLSPESDKEPEPVLSPEPEPVKETIMPPDTESAPMFTTIEKPMEWTLDNININEEQLNEVNNEPPVSYLEAASSDGYSVENVAFGDVSVGVETESVEFSVGHPLLRLFRNILIVAAIALVVSLLVTKFIAHHTSVDGSSMEPTLTDGDQLIVEQLSYYFHDPERFDIIVFPISTEDSYIKRIIGLPGETVQIRDSQIYINGNLLTDDHYGNEPMQDPGNAADTIYLQNDEYFVLGDNRNASIDSRFSEVGVIKKKDIKGRAFFRFFPFGSIGRVK